MTPIRLAILGASPCSQCTAACCKQNGHEYAALLHPDEWPRLSPFAQSIPIQRANHAIIEKVLPYKNGRCIFLGDDDRCTIYDDRPQSCRQFECVRGFHHAGSNLQSHGHFLVANPSVLKILENL